MVFNLGMASQLDLAGCEKLEELFHALQRQGVALRLAEVHGPIRDILRRSGFTTHCTQVEQNQTVASVLAAWHRERPKETA